MNKKGEYSIRDYFIAALFAGAAIGLWAIIIVSMAQEYDNPGIVSDDFNEKYSQFTEYTQKVESAKDSLSSDGGIQVLNIGVGFFKASYSFLQLVLSSFGLIGEPLDSFTEDYAVPFQVAAILFTLFSAVLIINLIVRILSSVTQGRL